MKIIDNFEQISKLLRFERTGDCYYLEILLRAKDGNKVQGKHNNGDRTIREILLNHEGHLEELRDEIIKLCHEFNARAYIRLNRRNYAAIGWHYVLEFIYRAKENDTKQFEHHQQDPQRNPFRAMSTACGKVNSEPRATTTWLIDLDDCTVDSPIVKAFEAEIMKPGMNMKIAPEDMIVAKIPSRTGIHLIVHPFNAANYIEEGVVACPTEEFRMMHAVLKWAVENKLPIATLNGFLRGEEQIEESDDHPYLTDEDVYVLEKNYRKVNDKIDIAGFNMTVGEFSAGVHKDQPTILYAEAAE